MRRLAAGRAACLLAWVAGSAGIAVPAALARSPAGECRAVVTDDTLRPLPPTLVPAARRAFGLHMPAEMVMRMTVWRCLDGAVLMCTEGANLPCGKADTARVLPGATAWCHQHPGADVVPMVATGHDTVYDWHCDDTVAVPRGPPRATDARGFIADVWKPLQPTTAP